MNRSFHLRIPLGFILLSTVFPVVANASTMNKSSEADPSFFGHLTDFLIHPAVIPILLTIGCLGLVLELFTPRIGLPGFVGIAAFALFFYGHLTAGIAGIMPLVLFAAGIILILLEMVLPGGIIGIIGFGAFLASFFLAAGNFVHMAFSLLIAFTVSILASIVMIKVYDRKMKFFKKLILTDATTTESGYVSNRNRTELLGIIGMALTDLRPSGTVLVEDERIDVVSEGSFIAKGTKVKFIKVEGSRIVVRELADFEKE
ncbi:membrane-bound ClpP family serine protease [Bacillus benzoevorans]|uniref:Membrane-bound ClpP family serine protease n=1 Tax=Bacillus benzoevorans TaxID=1456 RepID=A0A7X0HSC0_9BACI|nr:membrane-bound ClpP family serine protease [Bacillus benzoevorans]